MALPDAGAARGVPQALIGPPLDMLLVDASPPVLPSLPPPQSPRSPWGPGPAGHGTRLSPLPLLSLDTRHDITARKSRRRVSGRRLRSPTRMLRKWTGAGARRRPLHRQRCCHPSPPVQGGSCVLPHGQGSPEAAQGRFVERPLRQHQRCFGHAVHGVSGRAFAVAAPAVPPTPHPRPRSVDQHTLDKDLKRASPSSPRLGLGLVEQRGVELSRGRQRAPRLPQRRDDARRRAG